MLSSDEMILQIRKGNEEAIKLLFNYCDIFGNKLFKKIKQTYSFLGIEYDDIKSYLRIETLYAVNIYDMSKSDFLAFWLVVASRRIANKIREEHLGEYNYQRINADYNKSINLVEKKYGSLDKKVLELWAKGYKYAEIAEIYNLTQQKVTIIIFKAIKYLKSHKDEL